MSTICETVIYAMQPPRPSPIRFEGRSRRPESVATGVFSQRHNGFVRADVTYLKQDFSIAQEVIKADPWPKLQRFDFFVRTREATLAEIALANTPKAIEERNQESPQRWAVLNALQGLLEKSASGRINAKPARRDERPDPMSRQSRVMSVNPSLNVAFELFRRPD